MSIQTSAIDALRARIRRVEGGFGDRSLRRHFPTRLAGGRLDRALAGGGLPAGALTAILAAAEAAWTVAVLLAAAILRGSEKIRPPGIAPESPRMPKPTQGQQLTGEELLALRGDGRRGEAKRGPGIIFSEPLKAFRDGQGAPAGEAVLVDAAAELYPPAVAGHGLPLDRTHPVRPGRFRDAPWALEEALRSRGVAVAAGEIRRPDAAAVRRLELAAEAGGGVGLVLAREPEAAALARAPVVLRVGLARAPPARAPPGPLTFVIEVVRSKGGECRAGSCVSHCLGSRPTG